MAETTGIAWTTSSWNPWIGCTEVSPGCDNCYARTLDRRHRWGGATHWGAGVPRHRTKNWNAPLAWNKKAAKYGGRWTVFPSLCDPFDNEVPEEWRGDLWRLTRATPNLTWLLLTKRIGNAAKMMAGALGDNVWLGASVVNQEEADRDIPKLLATPAAKRFVSYEPALGPVSFRWLAAWDGKALKPRAATPVETDHLDGLRKLDWIIVGGESSQGGAKARPFRLEWARSARDQCRAAGVPYFFKQAGSNARFEYGINGEGIRYVTKDRAGADTAEWPADLQVQEMPA